VLESFKDAWDYLGLPNHPPHSGHPNEPSAAKQPVETPEDLQLLNRSSPEPYLKKSHPQRLGERVTVQAISARLYALAPTYGPRCPGSASQDPFYSELRTCLTLICQHILAASNKVSIC
jgi:hypothetical protein